MSDQIRLILAKEKPVAAVWLSKQEATVIAPMLMAAVESEDEVSSVTANSARMVAYEPA